MLAQEDEESESPREGGAGEDCEQAIKVQKFSIDGHLVHRGKVMRSGQGGVMIRKTGNWGFPGLPRARLLTMVCLYSFDLNVAG